MNSPADYTLIEYEIANISRIIDNQQKSVNELSIQRNHLPIRYTYDINNANDFEVFLKGKQMKLIKLIKNKIELENKLQKVHKERYKELENSNALSGVNDVIKMAFQYAHPIDTRTKKYAVEKRAATVAQSASPASPASVSRVIKSARSYSPGCRRDEYDNDKVYKKDRFELFLDFITANIIILRFVCVIAFIVIQFVYVIASLFSIIT